jgi:hypothetical protein
MRYKLAIKFIVNSKLQAIRTLPLIFAHYRSLSTKISELAFASRFLVTDLNNEDSAASVLTLCCSASIPQLISCELPTQL